MLNMKKELGTLNMPWEKEYGYAQAVKNGDTLWISGQLGHNTEGNLAEGMENQFEKTYDNILPLSGGGAGRYVNVYDVALGERDGNQTFNFHPTNPGQGSLSKW